MDYGVRRHAVAAAALLSLTGAAPALRAQGGRLPAAVRAPTAGAASAAALVDTMLHAFAAGSAEAFEGVDPDAGGRDLVRRAVANGWPRVAGGGRVVWAAPHQAVLLLTGYPASGNAGAETTASRAFSGLYAATDVGGSWHLTRRLPLDTANRILAQALTVDLQPGVGLRVVDTLTVSAGSPYGFAVRLNHRARLAAVRFDDRPVPYAFGGGLLWIGVSRGSRPVAAQRGAARPPVPTTRAAAPARPRPLVLVYDLPVARDTTAPNSGSFAPSYGHVRSQFFWHPFFDFSSDADRADVGITVRVPAAYRVATSVPQTETVIGPLRVVRGRTDLPAFALSLLYDREWVPTTADVGPLRFDLFATPTFAPAGDTVPDAVRRAYALLSARFGAPAGRYLAVAQARARPGGGWHFRSNDLVVTGTRGGGAPTVGGPAPRAYLGHEVAHGWTHPTGAATNWLSEGWATYAESLLLADAYGPEAERAFWERERNEYETGGFEGRATLLDDPANAGVSYGKGAWVLRMLRDALGDSAFARGVRAYCAIPPGRPAGAAEFTAALSHAAGRDVGAWLRPWLAEAAVPDVVAQLDGERLVLTQRGPVFDLALDVDLVTPTGAVRRAVRLTGQADTLAVRALLGAGGGAAAAPGVVPGVVRAVVLDPVHRLLLRRHMGELVRFVLSAPEVPDSARVTLAGDFAAAPVPAARQPDGTWAVALPLSAGQYLWRWRVDGRPVPAAPGASPRAGVQEVRPLTALEAPYPR